MLENSSFYFAISSLFLRVIPKAFGTHLTQTKEILFVKLVGSGGLVEFRNIETLEKILGELQGFFGDDVICVRKTGTRNHQFQMNFKVPF